MGIEKKFSYLGVIFSTVYIICLIVVPGKETPVQVNVMNIAFSILMLGVSIVLSYLLSSSSRTITRLNFAVELKTNALDDLSEKNRSLISEFETTKKELWAFKNIPKLKYMEMLAPIIAEWGERAYPIPIKKFEFLSDTAIIMIMGKEFQIDCMEKTDLQDAVNHYGVNCFGLTVTGEILCTKKKVF